MKPSEKQANSNNNSEDDDNDNSGGTSSARTTCLPYTEGRPDLPTYLARFSRPLSSHSTGTVSSDTTYSSTATVDDDDDDDVEGFEPSSGERTGGIVGGRKGPLGTSMGGLVFVCGPPGLVDAARGSAKDAGMDFRSEIFEL